jgi:hypothetical protein
MIASLYGQSHERLMNMMMMTTTTKAMMMMMMTMAVIMMPPIKALLTITLLCYFFAPQMWTNVRRDHYSTPVGSWRSVTTHLALTTALVSWDTRESVDHAQVD